MYLFIYVCIYMYMLRVEVRIRNILQRRWRRGLLARLQNDVADCCFDVDIYIYIYIYIHTHIINIRIAYHIEITKK